jgi:hypothetical protein
MSNCDEIEKKIENCSDEEVWQLFAHVNSLLKTRGLVRTRNITGERGEFLAVATYNSTPGLANLQAAPEGTQNVDALSRKGDRYSIKTISEPSNTTGVFYGLGSPEDHIPPEKKFEFAVIVILDKNLQLKKMLELNWDQVLHFRRWHSTMRAWNLSVTKALLAEAKIIFTL